MAESSRPIRCEVGENMTGTSKGIWIYIDDVLVWGHTASEGPLHWQTQSLLNAIWPDKVPAIHSYVPAPIPDTQDKEPRS